MNGPAPVKIISGGQTGVDRAALDAAMAVGIPHGGWCPRGRLAEDGIIPLHYRLQETETPGYDGRTERNVMDSDGTLIFCRDANLRGGTASTREWAERHGKPWLVLSDSMPVSAAVEQLLRFVSRHSIQTLNVAGPRESEVSGLGGYVKSVLTAWLQTPVQPAR